MRTLALIDIDECADDSNNCDANAVCTNTPGSFTCRCKKGYEGAQDGLSCTGIEKMKMLFLHFTYTSLLDSSWEHTFLFC